MPIFHVGISTVQVRKKQVQLPYHFRQHIRLPGLSMPVSRLVFDTDTDDGSGSDSCKMCVCIPKLPYEDFDEWTGLA